MSLCFFPFWHDVWTIFEIFKRIFSQMVVNPSQVDLLGRPGVCTSEVLSLRFIQYSLLIDSGLLLL